MLEDSESPAIRGLSFCEPVETLNGFFDRHYDLPPETSLVLA